MKTTINGKEILLREEILEKNLLEFIREDLDLTGTKKGCEIEVCGACTILINNEAVTSCRKLVKDVVGKSVMTIEGFENEDGALHPLQQAFIDCGAIQCGYCTPGMVLTGHALLFKNNNPTREEIKEAITPVICRCTGYQQIVDAIENTAKFY
ncbi:MAG: (2Fe-2S)-binding protein [Bacteroidetes bacterium]|nr:(2Fe-2S)-binding protein [Bacteroidota bacterium]